MGKLSSLVPLCDYAESHFDFAIVATLHCGNYLAVTLLCDCRMHSKVLRNHQEGGNCDV